MRFRTNKTICLNLKTSFSLKQMTTEKKVATIRTRVLKVTPFPLIIVVKGKQILYQKNPIKITKKTKQNDF